MKNGVIDFLRQGDDVCPFFKHIAGVLLTDVLNLSTHVCVRTGESPRLARLGSSPTVSLCQSSNPIVLCA